MGALRVVRVSSSLPLQKLLYYNFHYAVALSVTLVGIVVWQAVRAAAGARGGTAFPASIVAPALTAAWIVLEALRLRLGYSGNLTERVRARVRGARARAAPQSSATSTPHPTHASTARAPLAATIAAASAGA